MAKKNAREEPPKPQVSENEQMSDIVFILDKMELILEAVSQIGQDGKFNTVAADRQNRNSFLKIDRYADAFENFIKNFWSQLKDPTRFGILSVKEDRLDDPAVQQAIEDIAAGKKTKAVEEFLKQYEIVPRNKENQSINPKNQEEMAKKNETQQQAAAADSQPRTARTDAQGLQDQPGRAHKHELRLGRTENGRTSVLPAVHGGRSGARHPRYPAETRP